MTVHEVPQPDEVRRAVFLELVTAQDGGAGVRQSRELIAGRYGLSPDQVLDIARAGLAHGWPPL